MIISQLPLVLASLPFWTLYLGEWIELIIVFSRAEFERITEGLSDALGFTRTIGFWQESTPYERGGGRGALGEVDFYTRFAVCVTSHHRLYTDSLDRFHLSVMKGSCSTMRRL